MTDKEQIERISKLLNELSLDDITSTEFEETFPRQSINDIKDALWRMYCFASDVCDTINMGDTVEQEAILDKIIAEINAHKKELKTMADDDWYAGKLRGYECAVEIIDKYRQGGEQDGKTTNL